MTIEALKHLLNGGKLKACTGYFTWLKENMYIQSTDGPVSQSTPLKEWLKIYVNDEFEILNKYSPDSPEYKYEKLKAAYDDFMIESVINKPVRQPKKRKVKAWVYLVWYEYRNFPNDSLLQKTIECKAYTKNLSKSIISEWISEIYKQHKDSHIAQVNITNWKLLRKEYESE